MPAFPECLIFDPNASEYLTNATRMPCPCVALGSNFAPLSFQKQSPYGQGRQHLQARSTCARIFFCKIPCGSTAGPRQNMFDARPRYFLPRLGLPTQLWGEKYGMGTRTVQVQNTHKL
jgi:hypothetical protein